jgi:glycosyltransferase involved in cell wall biosynthesis/GT2 family glycosyltransferase
VVRIPRVLAHRAVECYQRELAKAQHEAEQVVSDRLRRLGMPVKVSAPPWASDARRLACQPYFSDDGPEVAIIVPTKNQHVVTTRCIDSLARTTYRNYQIYLVDNDSDDSEAIAYFASLQKAGVRVLKVSSPPGGFSYSFVNNRAVELTAGEPYLLFLNNDTEVINPRWLSQMMGWMRLPGVGSVGAQLLFPNGTIQHAGITHKLLYNVLPAPSLKCEPADQGGYQDYVHLNRDSAAQTAACLLTSRDIFIEQGMFDETHFSVAYNDCDYGFKLTQAGRRNVYCADAVLYHHEGYSRGVGRGNDKPSEEAAFVRKYINWEDPFYNPNLVLGKTDFSMRPTAVVTGKVPRLRVAVFSHNLNYEGAPRVLLEISTGLQKSRQMEVLVMSPEDGALRAEYEDAGCAVHVVPEGQDAFRSDERGFNAVTEIAGRLVAERVDVVIANTVLCWWAVEAANIARVPSTWIIHESEPPFTHLSEHGPECERRGRQALALPYRVVFVAEATRSVFADLETTNNFTVFHNGYDATSDHRSALQVPKAQARTGLNIPPDAFVGLLPGTVIDRKSQIDLVHAVRKLDLDVLRNLHLIILGDRPTPYSEALHREIALLGPLRQHCLSVLPYAAGAEQYFRAADFLISTSRIEAFPRVIQEAMFFEVPMIVAPVYGIVEQVSDEVSALFFPPGDAARLAQQIERLFRCPSLRERLAANARVTLDRFPTVQEMVGFYEKTLWEASLTV